MVGPLHRPLLAVALVTLAVALAGVNARATYGAQVTSDEPQYLLTALSLAEDFDLDIADELADERFLPFHEIPLNPQTIELDDDGRRLSPHDPLLPLLLALPMKLAGWQGAKVALAAMAAATAAMTAWVAIRRFGVSVGTATVVTAGFFAAPPLVGYGTQIYPEIPAALAVIIGLAALSGSPQTDGPPVGRRSRMVAMAAIVALPWLSVKYVPVAAVLAVALLVRLASAAPWSGGDRARRTWPAGVKTGVAARMVATAAALAGFGAIYLLFHRRVYGGWTVYGVGDHFVDGEFLVLGSDPNYLGRSRRLVGLLIDRGFGLMAWAPAYLATIPALVFTIRGGNRSGIGPGTVGPALMIWLVGAGWAVATWVALTMHGWWWPGRQLVVILPVVVVAVAVLVDGRPGLRAAVVVASVAAVGNWLWLVVEANSGRRTLVVDFTETAAPLHRALAPLLPDHRSPEPSDWLLTLAWTALFALLGLLAWRSAQAAP